MKYIKITLSFIFKADNYMLSNELKKSLNEMDSKNQQLLDKSVFFSKLFIIYTFIFIVLICISLLIQNIIIKKIEKKINKNQMFLPITIYTILYIIIKIFFK